MIIEISLRPDLDSIRNGVISGNFYFIQMDLQNNGYSRFYINTALARDLNNGHPTSLYTAVHTFIQRLWLLLFLSDSHHQHKCTFTPRGPRATSEGNVLSAATVPAWSPHTEPLKRVWLSPHKAPFPKCSNFSHDMISWGSKQNYSFFLLISPLSKMGLDGYSAKSLKYGFYHSFFGSMPRCFFYKLAIFAPSQVCNPNFSSHVTKQTCFTVDASECTGSIMVGG